MRRTPGRAVGSTSITTRLSRELRVLPSCKYPEPFSAIDAGAHALPPGAVVEVPSYGLRKPGLERLGRAPSKLALDLARINGIARVVTWPVCHEADELLA